MKFSRILGVAVVVLLSTAAAKQPTPAPAQTSPAAQSAMPAAAAAQPAIKPTPTANTGSPAAAQGAAQVTAMPEAAPAPVAALEDATPPTFGDPKAGQAKAGACAACHGLDGNSTDPQYPRLAGQHERYIWRQLHLFKTGQRLNPIMQGMAAPLSGQDMRDIGAYFATQHSGAGLADDSVITEGPNASRKYWQVGERLFRAGRPADKVPACMACHGPAGRGNPGPSYPQLGGQHGKYTVARLQYFRGGGVSGKDKDANLIMTEAAKNLTDEDIQGLATYIEGLHAAAPATAKAP